VACSSIEFYGNNVIPGWASLLLISPLKKDRIYRVKLNDSGTGTTGDTISYFIGDGNRIRRITAAPDGFRFYVARDVSATVNGGAIVEYTYTGSVLILNPGNTATNITALKQVRIYPNPSQNILNIQSKRGIIKPIKAQLYDLNGKVIKQVSSNLNEFSIDISSYPSGTYLLKLFNGYDIQIQTEKIIKQ
ncbi:MAG TPA: T9SS type A sorting domain-containing protein, partial [Ferruginibacter sp.]|nr:T9SS type A sorting domain-containing protein [Ferruginibacter sp.]